MPELLIILTDKIKELKEENAKLKEEIKALKKGMEGQNYNPSRFMYNRFNQLPPEKPKSKARRKLEWFIMAVMGALVLWIMLVDKGVMR